jgi:para-aminobenzoate synthetase / 4-amino-4-deoxychorismate lyase
LSGELIIHDASAAQWLHFKDPLETICTGRLADIIPALARIESLVSEKGLYAAGFLSYEAAKAFDSALTTRAPRGFPSLWFGIYRKPQPIDLPDPDFGAYSLGDSRSSVSRQDYGRAISAIKKSIRSGDTYQVNYTIRLISSFEGSPWHLFLAMIRAQSPGYAAWADIGRYAICSASPELFFRLDGNRLTSKPMKGTVRRGRMQEEDKSLAEWLRLSEKNRAENLMIVDMIRNDIGRVADPGTVHVPQMFEVERHPTLWQMTSTVMGDCSRPVTEIFRALFPCASITGAPKIRTTQIIAELETEPRGLYTGCIGFIAPGRSAQFNVAIRTAVVDRDSGQAEYGSGGGIVWDSAAEDEYKEALLKSRVLREQRPEFSLLETLLWTPEDGYFLLDGHLRRLSDSADYFGYFVDPEEVKERLLQGASRFVESQRVRLLVPRSGAIRIEAAVLAGTSGSPIAIKLSPDPVDSADLFLYHKTTQRRVYEAAQRNCPDCEDVLLWNERGELTESCIANLVLEINGRLLTPPVHSGLLAGTFRALLIAKGTIQEQVLTPADLKRCSKIYLVNSVRKWREAVLKS